MISTSQFGDELKRKGYTFYSGVPCSFLKYLINYAINECDYVMAANEGDAIATASGAYLGGKKSVVLMQNSGLTNATSPLTSLNYTFQIPVLGFVSLRGEPGLNDEPQHELMGQITEQMLSLMKIEWAYLSQDSSQAKSQLKAAHDCVVKGQTFFFIVKKNTFDEVVLRNQNPVKLKNESVIKSSNNSIYPPRRKALEILSRSADKHTILLATTGKTGRELFEVADLDNNLYMVGSMGCISSLGLGLAMAKPDKKIIVIDGDGSALMRMGAFATNAYYRPQNMLHILLDNNTHDSTGGQSTVSHNIDFVDHAASMCYPTAIAVSNLEELGDSISKWLKHSRLTFIHLRIAKGSTKGLGRPTIKPVEVKARIMKFINR